MTQKTLLLDRLLIVQDMLISLWVVVRVHSLMNQLANPWFSFVMVPVTLIGVFIFLDYQLASPHHRGELGGYLYLVLPWLFLSLIFSMKSALQSGDVSNVVPLLPVLIYIATVVFQRKAIEDSDYGYLERIWKIADTALAVIVVGVAYTVLTGNSSVWNYSVFSSSELMTHAFSFMAFAYGVWIVLYPKPIDGRTIQLLAIPIYLYAVLSVQYEPSYFVPATYIIFSVLSYVDTFIRELRIDRERTKRVG